MAEKPNHRELAHKNLSAAHSQAQHLQAVKDKGAGEFHEESQAIAISRSNMATAHAILALVDVLTDSKEGGEK